MELKVRLTEDCALWDWDYSPKLSIVDSPIRTHLKINLHVLCFQHTFCWPWHFPTKKLNPAVLLWHAANLIMCTLHIDNSRCDLVVSLTLHSVSAWPWELDALAVYLPALSHASPSIRKLYSLPKISQPHKFCVGLLLYKLEHKNAHKWLPTFQTCRRSVHQWIQDLDLLKFHISVKERITQMEDDSSAAY